MTTQFIHPVAVIGSGPAGLAAAAHLHARGVPFKVFEAGATLAHSFEQVRHVRLFSPWRYNVDKAAAALLTAEGWQFPPEDDLPTAGEVVDKYLVPLAATAGLSPHIQLRSRVMAISRATHDKVKTAGREDAPFVLHVDHDGVIQEQLAAAVIDASGTWSQPNPIGVNGLPALGERENAARIAYGMPDILGRDRARYQGKRVLVVGAGHSAAGNLLALASLAEHVPGTRVVWAVRGNDLTRLFGGGAKDGLPARGELGSRLRELAQRGQLELHYGFRIRSIASSNQGLSIHSEDSARPAITAIDEIVAATGSRPDLGITRELRLRLDPWLESTEELAPLIDPNVHSCGTVRPHGHRELAHPEQGFYAIGAKSYGRAPNFLMATGFEQARSVVAALAGDMQAADDVQLDLPETGVCSTDFAAPGETVGGCCGGPAVADKSSCCVLDEQEKSKGKAGCGCGSPSSKRPIGATA
jgi:thioredoxin reductase